MDNSTNPQTMRPYIIPLLLGALALLLIYIYEQDQHVQSLQSTTESLTSELIVRKNQYGELLTEHRSMEVRVKDLQQQNKLAEKIRKEFDIKLRDLRSYQQTTFNVDGQGHAGIKFLEPGTVYVLDGDTIVIDGRGRKIHTYDELLVYPDKSIQPFALVAQDGYLDFQADVYDSLHAPYTYTYSDTVTMAFIRRGPWWNKKLYGSTLLNNKNAKVVNSESIWIRQADHRWGIGPSVTYGVTRDGLQTTFGISVQYSLIRF